MLLLLVVLFSGCSWLPRAAEIVTIREPVEVKVAVPIPCVSNVPPRPVLLSDDELASLGDYAFVLGLRRNGLALQAYVAELEALLVGCRRVPGL